MSLLEQQADLPFLWEFFFFKEEFPETDQVENMRADPRTVWSMAQQLRPFLHSWTDGSPTAPLTLLSQLFPVCPASHHYARLAANMHGLSLSLKPLLEPAAPVRHSLPFCFFSHSKFSNLKIVLTTSISFPSIPPLNIYDLAPTPRYFWKLLLMQLYPKWFFLTFLNLSSE